MKFKKLKSIISLILVVLILLPSFGVIADTGHILNEVGYEVIDNNYGLEGLQNEIIVTEDISHDNNEKQEDIVRDEFTEELLDQNIEEKNEIIDEKYEFIISFFSSIL